MKKRNSHIVYQLFQYVIGIFFTILGTALQAQDYQNRFKEEICTCIEEKGPSVRSLDGVYMACFREKLVNYTNAIDLDIQEKEPSLASIKRQQRRVELMILFQHELVYNCDVYYDLLEKGRQLQLITMRANTEASALKKMNENIALSPSAFSYSQRGALYFALDDLDKAKQDLEKTLDLNPYARDAQIMLAWVLEEKGKYSESKMMLDELYTNKFQKDIAILRAIIIRKMGGRKDIPIFEKPSNQEGSIKERINSDSRRRARGEEATRGVNNKDKTDQKNATRRKSTQKNKQSKSINELFRRKGGN